MSTVRRSRRARPSSRRDAGRLLLSIAAAPVVLGALRVRGSRVADRSRRRGAAADGAPGAGVHAQLEELRASRTRFAEATLSDRRWLERALHDGPQQRLVALSLTLRLAQGRMQEDPEAAGDLLAAAQAELGCALEDLRELARCIHPAVLSDRGLRAALEALAARCPIPVEIAEVCEERLPAPIETAAYHVIAEAVRNVVSHAGASHATISVAQRGDRVVVQVCDDGVGGADPARGTGLRRLADQVAAFDGRMRIDGEPGHGTCLRAEFPV
jgi:signal transduction histidine kinase